MSGVDIAGLVLGAVASVLDAYDRVENNLDARKDLGKLLPGFKKRVGWIRTSIIFYFHGKPLNRLPAHALGRIQADFDKITKELDLCLEKHDAKFIVRRNLRLKHHVEEVRRCADKLEAIEAQIHNLGVQMDGMKEILDVQQALLQRFQELLQNVQKNPTSRDDAEISKVLHSFSESDEKVGIVDVIPVRAKKLLDALSKSGIPDDTKLKLSEMARDIWERWMVNSDDIKFVKKPSGDKHLLGTGREAHVYLAHMQLPGIKGRLEVAVKQFFVRSSQAREQLPIFIREVFLQKQAYHPCIVKTYGGYWPGDEEVQNEKLVTPYIVMELMTNSLQEEEAKQSLKSLGSKRRILRDVAEAIAHLHSCGIVHRDIKPENVLLNIANGRIIGRAKVCDFGISRKAHITGGPVDNTKTTGIAGNSAYRAPEAGSRSARQGSKTARDIWSLGVLICEVLVPDFVAKLVQDHPGILDSAPAVREVAEKKKGKPNLTETIIKRAKLISSDNNLKDIAIKCLLLEPKSRPGIEDVLKLLPNGEPAYEFFFMNYVNIEHREEEVVRYIRNRYDVEAQESNLVAAVAILEKEAGAESPDLTALNLLAYCHYYGIGVQEDEQKAISLYQHGCNVENATAMSCLGAIHFSARSFDAAVPLLQKAAGKGSVEAMIWLSTCYAYGYGAERNEKEALELVSFAAAQLGNQEAQTRLAAYHRKGIGTAENKGKAIAMLSKLFAKGSPAERERYKLWYKEGNGFPIEKKDTEEFLAMARKRGIVDSWVFSEERNRWVIPGQ